MQEITQAAVEMKQSGFWCGFFGEWRAELHLLSWFAVLDD